MRRQAVSTLDEGKARSLVAQIPFFNDLSLQDHKQFNLLLQHSTIVELEPGEIVMEKGSVEPMFYFLLKGQLNVFSTEVPGKRAIGQLSVGQVFGALSIINEQPRTATLASSNTQASTLISTDFRVFGELNDFTQVTLATKLSLLRIVVNNIRWKLEVNRKANADHKLVKKLDDTKKFSGTKGSIEELEHLAEQAFFLGQLMDLWNDEIPDTITLENKPMKPKSAAGKLMSFFSKK